MTYDPFDPALADAPYDALSALRAECPVSEPRPGVKVVVRHADVSAAFRSWATFSNAGGLRLGHVKPEEEQTLNEIDPPRHGPIRRILLTALSPKAIVDAEPYITELARRTVRRLVERGSADLVEDLAVPVPSTVIAHMLGVPEEDRGRFHEWTSAMVEDKAASPGGVRGEASASAEQAFNDYIARQVTARRAMSPPPDDIITRMIDTEVRPGVHLSDTEIVTQVRFLLMAGNETTTNLVANLLYELMRAPAQWRRLAADRELLPAAIEESLRHDSPVQLMLRTATEDTEIAGCPVHKGERVVLHMGSANRDADVFADADAFDLDRGLVRNHLGFGLGAHLCVGAPLARLQTRHVMDALLDASPEPPALDADFVYEKVNFFVFRGPKHLPVAFAVR
jgi:cytochrome P450